MPELPDLELYRACLRPRVVGHVRSRVRVASPFLVRSVAPPLAGAEGREVIDVERLGKRLVVGLAGDLFLVLHLMIAGRLRWRPPGDAIPKRLGLAAFDFDTGSLVITEAGSTRRASLHLAGGRAAMRDLDRGGLEPVWCTCGELFYRNGNRWMSVRVRTQPDLQWDTPRLRFETDFVDTPGRSYDVSPDGTRLLVVKRATADVRNRIDLVVNWQQPPRDAASR